MAISLGIYPIFRQTHIDFSMKAHLVNEELRSDLHRLEARLQRLETRNGLDLETLKSPLSLGDGNEKLVEDPEEKVADQLGQLGQLELNVRDAVSIGETQPSEDLPDEQAGKSGDQRWKMCWECRKRPSVFQDSFMVSTSPFILRCHCSFPTIQVIKHGNGNPPLMIFPSKAPTCPIFARQATFISARAPGVSLWWLDWRLLGHGMWPFPFCCCSWTWEPQLYKCGMGP